MAGGYSRKMILLRREDGTSAGFLRLETQDGRCAAEMHAETSGSNLRALLLRPGDGKPCELGTFSRGKSSLSVPSEDVEGCTQAAVFAGDKLMLIGGDAADFASIRKRLAQRARPLSTHAKAQPPQSQRANAVSTQNAETAKRDIAPVDTHHSAAVIPDHLSTCNEDACRTEAQERPAAVASVLRKHPLERDGWVISSRRQADGPERITGERLQDGRSVATLVGVAGGYAVEPPPGLQGFHFANGYWIRIRRM